MSQRREGGQPFGHDGTPGQPLPPTVRQQMETQFGSDFSNVKIHAGSMSTVHQQGAKAEAFTQGDQIFIAPGAYQPGTESGTKLIAHELAHIVQQPQGSSQR